MALTLTNLRDVIVHRLGGSLASQLSQDGIINEAGRLLTVMHPWRFLERPPASLDFTSGTAYVALPSDYGQLVAYSYSTDIGLFQFTDFMGLLTIRAQNVSNAGSFWGAISSPGQTSVTLVPPVQRIELAPTPSTSVTGALLILYRARWTELSSSTDVANIPWYVESLLRELVAAIALGYSEHDNATTDQRLALISQGTLFITAKQYDSMSQPDYGPLCGGAVQFGNGGRIPFDSGIPGPS